MGGYMLRLCWWTLRLKVDLINWKIMEVISVWNSKLFIIIQIRCHFQPLYQFIIWLTENLNFLNVDKVLQTIHEMLRTCMDDQGESSCNFIQGENPLDCAYILMDQILEIKRKKLIWMAQLTSQVFNYFLQNSYETNRNPLGLNWMDGMKISWILFWVKIL